MAKNKIITSEGNVQFIFGDTGKVINVHPFHIYTSFNEDTVSFLLLPMPKSSGLAIFTSKAEDLEFDGETYSFSELPAVIAEAFAEAGAKARWEIVQTLPASGRSNTIYLVPKEDGTGYDEYIWIKDEERWELIGDTDIELARYLKKSDFNAYSGAVETRITEDERVWGAALNDLNSRINTVSGDVATKASQSAVDALNGVVTAHTANTTVHVTSAEKATWNNKSDFSGSYNDLTNKLSAGTNITIVDNVINATGGGSTYTAGDGIDITNDVISVTGKVDTTDFNTYSGAVETRLTEDEEVTAAGLNALNDKFGGLKLMKITQAAYDALTVKDNNTLYIISD